MQEHLLNKFGFEIISVKEKVKAKSKKTEKIATAISIIQPNDHANPQILVRLPREILTQMKWEISDRLILMANSNKNSVALIKTHKKQKDTFAISTQGASIQVAKETKRGGIVKVGWRGMIGKTIPHLGTYNTKMEIFEGALIIKFPKEMFIEQPLAA